MRSNEEVRRGSGDDSADNCPAVGPSRMRGHSAAPDAVNCPLLCPSEMSGHFAARGAFAANHAVNSTHSVFELASVHMAPRSPHG
jgi:hypothetical protein